MVFPIKRLSYRPAPWEILPELSSVEAEGEIEISDDEKTAVVKVTKVSNKPVGNEYSEQHLDQLAKAVSHTWTIVGTGYEKHAFHLRRGEQPVPMLSVHIPRE